MEINDDQLLQVRDLKRILMHQISVVANSINFSNEGDLNRREKAMAVLDLYEQGKIGVGEIEAELGYSAGYNFINRMRKLKKSYRVNDMT